MARLRESIIRKSRKAMDKMYEALAVPDTADEEEGVLVTYDNGDRTECTDCGGIDPINKEPINPNCTTCNGLAYPYSETTIQVSGIISKIGPDSMTEWGQLAAGRFEVGDVRFSGFLQDVLIDSTDLNGDTYFDKAIRVVIQGRTYTVKHNPIVRGIAGDRYTIAVYLTRNEGRASS